MASWKKGAWEIPLHMWREHLLPKDSGLLEWTGDQVIVPVPLASHPYVAWPINTIGSRVSLNLLPSPRNS